MINITVQGNMGKPDVAIQLENDIDWDFTKFNPGIVKNAQNLREFDKWLTWIKETFDMNVPFNYLEVGSYAGESLFYLSQIFPKGSQITLVDLGDNKKAREILYRTCKYIEITYGHKIVLCSGLSDNPDMLKQIMAYPKGQSWYDLVFIDANHDFEWAFKDYLNFRDKATWTAFHDISNFNITKNFHKYGKDIANAAHLWKGITSITPKRANDEQLWEEFVDYDNDVDMAKMDLKPRGIGVWKN